MKVETFLGVLLVINVVELLSTDSYTFICNTSPSTSLTRWTFIAGPNGTALMSYQNGKCTLSPSDSFLSNSIRYLYACNGTAYQVTVKPNPVQSRRNHILSCRDAYQLGSKGSTWIFKTRQANGSCSYCNQTMIFDVKEITEGGNVTFICRVESGVSYVNWNKFGSPTAAMDVNQNGQCSTSTDTTFLDNTSKYNYTCNQTVYQVTIYNVTRHEHNDIYMCTPFGQTEGTRSNWVIKVEKAPVTTVSITAPPHYQVNVTENTVVEFTCTTSTARPAATIYWYRHPNGQDSDETQITSNVTTTSDYNDLSVTTSILRLFVTRQDNNTKVFCRANNAVNQTLTRSRNKILLNVAYTSDDPYIVEGREYRVIENTPGTLSCTVRGGNPTPTLSWSNNFLPTNQSTKNANGNVTSTLTWNVSRNHDGRCTCKSHQTGFTEKSVDVRLTVLYEATIKSFTIEVIDVTKNTVDENGTVNFICTADSNPEAMMTLRHERNVLETVTSNNVNYNINKARCSDAGTYYCSATNKYIGKNVSTQTVELFVKCAPRVAGEVNTNITSAKNALKTITVNVIAYPSPTFIWSQLIKGMWALLDNNTKFVINSSTVQSNLTIRSVSENDFTKYQVIVKNKVGQMEQNFTLSPYGIPDIPTDLKHVQSHTTTSSIHIEWRPGYNGGPTQTFYIKYKKSSDSTWTYFTVIDNGEENMDISLTDLAEDTQYDIVIFASNIIGNSSESQVLVASTEATNLGPLIGGIAGGVIVCIIIVIVIIVIIRRNKFSDGLVDNPMYISSSHVARPASPSPDVKAELVKPDKNGSNDLYAQVQKTKKKDESVYEYEIVDGNTENKKRSNMKKPPQGKAATNESKMSNINQDGLNYADLVFNGSQPVEKKEMKVYEPTSYDLVDFTKKAEPLPDSDDDDNK